MFRLSSLFRFLLLSVLMVTSMGAFAQEQEGCRYDKLVVDYTATESTCQRNGTLTFTPRGEHATNYYQYTYEIRSMIAGGVNIPATGGTPQSDGVSGKISEIPAGTYRVIVKAICKDDPNYSLPDFVLENVKVPGTYKVPNVYYDGFKSRGSYAECPSGKIVLDVSEGSGDFKVTVVESPNDQFNGEVTPVISGTSFALPGEKYPAGNYKIEVYDRRCDYTASTNFQLSSFTELPTLTRENRTAFYPVIDPDPNCNAIRLSTSVSSNFYNNRPAIRAAIESGFYEIGVSHKSKEPAVWYPLTLSFNGLVMSLGTTKVNELYKDGDLKVTIRLKECPSIQRSFTTYLNRYFTTSITNFCGYSEVGARPWTDYDGHYCFPVTAKIYLTEAAFKADPNNTVGSQVLNRHSDNAKVTLKAGESRYIVFTDVDGQQIDARTYRAPTLGFYRQTSNELISCEGFYAWFYYNGATCEGVTYRVFDVSNPATPRLLCENITPNTRTTCQLPYDTDLRAELVVPQPDGKPDLIIQHDFREPSPNFNITLGDVEVDYCLTNVARFRVRTDPNRMLPVGTRVKVTGPNGFLQEMTIPTSGYYWDFPKTRMDPGVYTAEVKVGECYTKTVDLNLPTLLDVKSFAVTKNRSCAQMQVFPKGMMTYLNKDEPSSTVYSIVSGPEGGYDPSQRITQAQVTAKPDETFFSLTKPGTYMVGISYANNCNLQLTPVTFERTNLRLDNTRTIAFSCLDGSTDGHLYVRATEGFEPYTYKVYDERNEDPVGAVGTVIGDRMYFQHGHQNETFTLRIQDYCENRFSIPITILDLSKQTVGSAVRTTICVGDPVEFTSLPLGKYLWEKETAPNSNEYTFFSNEQNPIIQSAKPSDSGRYRITLEAVGCTKKSIGYVNIQVVPCYAPVNPSLMNKYGNF